MRPWPRVGRSVRPIKAANYFLNELYELNEWFYLTTDYTDYTDF